MIFFRKGVKGQDKKGKDIMYNLENKINETVFPGLQGGPHNHSITALSVALKQAKTPEFTEYQGQIIKNCAAFSDKLKSLGYDIVSGGTDNHMLLIDLSKTGISGAKAEKIMDLCNITCNKNTVPKDKSALNPSGLRVGSPAMTSRGFMEQDFEQVAVFIDRCIKLGLDLQGKVGSKKLVDFEAYIKDNNPSELVLLRDEIENFCGNFQTIGF